MRLTTFGKLLFGCILVFVFLKYGNQQATSNENLYILHTRNGDIKCTYHNSRDLNNGWMIYYDAVTKEEIYIERWKVDSVTVLKENFLFCGPRDEKLKYISTTTSN